MQDLFFIFGSPYCVRFDVMGIILSSL